MTEDELGAVLRPFTNLQWFFARGGHTVHFLCASPQDIDRAEFDRLFALSMTLAPQLQNHESLARDGYLPPGPEGMEGVAEYFRSTPQDTAIAEIDAFLGRPFADTGRPTYRVRCHASDVPDEIGVRSWLIFESSHAILEGGDVSTMLRGRPSAHETRPLVSLELIPLQSLGLCILSYPLALMHLGTSWFARRSAPDYGHARVALNRRDVSRAAQALGVSQRALLFGLVLHATRHRPGRRLFAGYVSLPEARAHLYDDEYANLRTDEFRYRGADDLRAFIAGLEDVLQARRAHPLWVHALHMRVLGAHRRLFRWLPWIYPGRFFRFERYDMMLSLLPPVRPARTSAALSGAVPFAGSNTGRQSNCIFVVAEDWVTLSFWAGPRVHARIDQLLAEADTLGIETQDWRS